MVKGWLIVAGAALLLVMCSGANRGRYGWSLDELAPPAPYHIAITPDEVSRAFAGKRLRADRWDIYGENPRFYRLAGTIVAKRGPSYGTYAIEIAANPVPVVLGGVAPGTIARGLKVGDEVAAFCKGVMIAPRDSRVVLESQCWLDRDFFAAFN